MPNKLKIAHRAETPPDQQKKVLPLYKNRRYMATLKENFINHHNRALELKKAKS